MNMDNCKVSVIVPIYKVEKFIGRCAESLMSQTLDDVEYIFVNDATPDNSMDVLDGVLKKYPARAGMISILKHEVNRGLPAARNTGLAAAHGEYVFHCDSDDFVNLDMLEKLYGAAEKNDADIVWCDYYVSYNDSERYMKQPCYSTAQEALSGMLCGRMKYNVWNKLVRRNLYNEHGISFLEGYSMGEDMTMMLLFPFAKKVVYVEDAFYHYVQWNSSSLTRGLLTSHIDSLRNNADRVIQFLSDISDKTWVKDINSFKLLMKWPFLTTDMWNSYRLWQKWFPEANKHIWESKEVSFRIKFVEWCAAKKQYWIVWLHYWIVLKFLYNVMYK